MPFAPPPRRRGVEYLDDPTLDPTIAARSLRDVAVSNALFGGRSAVLREIDSALLAASHEGCRALTLLDVGAGLGDIPQAAVAHARRFGITLRTIGLEMTGPLAALAARRTDRAVAADALALPFATDAIDIVCCSQLLHHLDDTAARQAVTEMERVARRRVVVSDIRRSRVAAALLWLASFPLRFHPVSRHDGVLSVFRGYTADELRALVTHAVGREPVARTRPGWRVTASWSPLQRVPVPHG
ncbi:MAG: methyltransferase domain-containing protein [Gemmatimonadaceae bacterium]|jgi:SAM-dependent methyltransferase|nr:methyltransferase domain-containing protein [Gemmatimonadaceae bacterium]